MKNNQNMSKVEERKSVANQCDYSRSNGQCGCAFSDNFGKPCPGRSCEVWKCDAENIAVTVVEPLNRLTAEPLNYKSRVSDQYAAIETAKDNLLRECVKFGALLLEVSYYLGSTQGKKGEGLQAWLSENCPQINYKTAMGYKRMGEMAVTKLGGGSQAVAVLQDKTEVIPPGEDAPIEVESKFIEKRDELFNEVKSRRELEQAHFKFMASEGKGKPGRPKGTGAGTVEYKKKSTMECAVEAVWPIVQHLLKHRGEMFTAYKMLPDEKLTEFRDTLTEHVKAIEAVLAGREN